MTYLFCIGIYSSPRDISKPAQRVASIVIPVWIPIAALAFLAAVMVLK